MKPLLIGDNAFLFSGVSHRGPKTLKSGEGGHQDVTLDLSFNRKVKKTRVVNIFLRGEGRGLIDKTYS